MIFTTTKTEFDDVVDDNYTELSIVTIIINPVRTSQWPPWSTSLIHMI